MDGFPRLPGYTFDDPSTRTGHSVRHVFEYINGYAVVKKTVPPVGEVLDSERLQYYKSIDPVRYDPSLTYGRTKTYVPPVFKPHFVLYDKKCLTFRAYFKQSVVESQNERYRVRKVNILFFLEDDTMTVMEPPVSNAGMPQGRLVKRGKLVKDSSGSCWGWKDLNVGMDIPIYGIVYHIASCDLYTREFLISQGVDVNPDEEMPSDPYEINRKGEFCPRTSVTPKSEDKLRKFLEFDGKVLRFYAIWRDNTSAIFPYVINYFLGDDTIELLEVTEKSNKMKSHRTILKRMKIPKDMKSLPANFPSIFLERNEECEDFFRPGDFIIGATVLLLDRRFLIYDCDPFTRKYFSCCLNIEQGEPIKIEQEEVKPKLIKELAPYLGFGTIPDSLQSCLHFNPRKPKTDLIRYLINMNKKLRYSAVMDFVHPEDEGREFVIEYRLHDGTITISELKQRNSGFIGGRFLKPTLVPKPRSSPNNPEYYTPADLTIGSLIDVFGHKFKITGLDFAVYRYMEANQEKFKPEMLEDLRAYLTRDAKLCQDLKDTAEAAEGTTEQIPLPIENALYTSSQVPPADEYSKLGNNTTQQSIPG